MTFKLGIQHWGLGPYKDCSDDCPWLTMTYFMARSALLPYAFIWENTLIVDFIETFEACELKVGTNS